MIIDKIRDRMRPGVVIPKPEAKESFTITGWGRRRGEEALIYNVPNHSNPSKPHQKDITVSEFEKAYRQLTTSGLIDRRWFNENLPDCAKEGGCNFTTIGGIFELLGEAAYTHRGEYEST